MLTDKRILITGGTGSLGKVLTRTILSGVHGMPKKVVIFSRDEAKQHFMRLEYQNKKVSTDEIIYSNFERVLSFQIGDVRDYHSMCSALAETDIVINAAALKQVPACEYFPYEAVQTNVTGPENIVRALRENYFKVETVVGVSTDKACKPVNVMGMTKAIQERLFILANLCLPETRFVCVRYGNVLASRGSVIPLFNEQILKGGPLTITTPNMTRYLLSLDSAVEMIFASLKHALPGETYIPRIPAARIIDLAKALIGDRDIEIKEIGIRPGEKIDENLISEEEGARTYERGDYFVVRPIVPELTRNVDIGDFPYLNREYTSADSVFSLEELVKLLKDNRCMPDQLEPEEEEFLR